MPLAHVTTEQADLERTRRYAVLAPDAGLRELQRQTALRQAAKAIREVVKPHPCTPLQPQGRENGNRLGRPVTAADLARQRAILGEREED